MSKNKKEIRSTIILSTGAADLIDAGLTLLNCLLSWRYALDCGYCREGK